MRASSDPRRSRPRRAGADRRTAAAPGPWIDANMAWLSHGAFRPRLERVSGRKVDAWVYETYQQSSGRAPGRPVGKWTEGDVMEPIAAVVLAAGKGTRMKSEKAKVLHRALGRPMAYFPVRAALS